MNTKIAIKELTIEYDGYCYYEKITTTTNYGECKIEYIVSDSTTLTTHDSYDTIVLEEKTYNKFLSELSDALFVKVPDETLTSDEKHDIAVKIIYRPEYISKYKIKAALEIDGKVETYNEEFIEDMLTNKQHRLILILNRFLKKEWKLNVLGMEKRF